MIYNIHNIIYIYIYIYIYTHNIHMYISGGTIRDTSMNTPLLRLQSSEGKFTRSREIEPVRRSFCRRRSCTFTKVTRLAHSGCTSVCETRSTRPRRAPHVVRRASRVARHGPCRVTMRCIQHMRHTHTQRVKTSRCSTWNQ